MMLAGIVSCKEDEIETAAEVKLEFEDAEIPKPVLDKYGASAEVSFTANADWSVTVDASRALDWLRVYPARGSAGNVTLTITAAPNTDYDDRNAAVAIKCGSAEYSFTVSQKSADGLIVESSRQEIGPEGGLLSFSAQSNRNLSFEIADDAKDWIEVSARSRGLEPADFTVNVAPNDGFDPREGAIRVSAGDATEIIHIYQSATKRYLLLSATEVTLPCGESTFDVEVRANSPHKMTMPVGCDWISEDKSRGESSYTYHFRAARNTSVDGREAVITFRSDDGSLEATVQVYQCPEPAIAVARDYYELSGSAQRLDFKIQANTEFVTDVDVPWIKPVQGFRSRAFEEYNLCFDIAANNETEDYRTGTISVSSPDGSVSQFITVRQWNSVNRIVDIKSHYDVFFMSYPVEASFLWFHTKSYLFLVHTITYADGSVKEVTVDPAKELLGDDSEMGVNFSGAIPGMSRVCRSVIAENAYPPFFVGSRWYDGDDPHRLIGANLEYITPDYFINAYTSNPRDNWCYTGDSHDYTEILHVPRHEVKLNVGSVEALNGMTGICSPIYNYATVCSYNPPENYDYFYGPQICFLWNNDAQWYTAYRSESFIHEYELYRPVYFNGLTDYEIACFERYFGRPATEIEMSHVWPLTVGQLIDIFGLRGLENPVLGLPDGQYSLDPNDGPWTAYNHLSFYGAIPEKHYLVGPTPGAVKVLNKENKYFYGEHQCWYDLHYPIHDYELARFAIETLMGKKTLTHTPQNQGNQNWNLKFRTVEDNADQTVFVAELNIDSDNYYNAVAPGSWQLYEMFNDRLRLREIVVDTLVHFKEKPGAPFSLDAHLIYDFNIPVGIILSDKLKNASAEDFIVECPDMKDCPKVFRYDEDGNPPDDGSIDLLCFPDMAGRLAILTKRMDLDDIPGRYNTRLTIRHKDYPEYAETLYAIVTVGFDFCLLMPDDEYNDWFTSYHIYSQIDSNGGDVRLYAQGRCPEVFAENTMVFSDCDWITKQPTSVEIIKDVSAEYGQGVYQYAVPYIFNVAPNPNTSPRSTIIEFNTSSGRSNYVEIVQEGNGARSLRLNQMRRSRSRMRHD